MNSSLKKRIFLVTIFGTAVITGTPVLAADKYEKNKTKEEKYLTPTDKDEEMNLAFTNVGEDTFLYVRSEPTIESEWVGKLYPGSASEITGPVGEWTSINSGGVTGYVYTQYILTGEEAEEKASEITVNSDEKDIRKLVTWAESRAAEEERLAKEEEERQRLLQEQRDNAESVGQAVVDYACQFIGNPYVWGGTSLTEGADCSGFVQTIYSHFGVQLPRTTWDQEYSGTRISYEEAVAGDLILYEGHVGIYMGDGQIVNAINPSKGIGVIPATCMNIKTVRRVL